jgi:hypothetical protein
MPRYHVALRHHDHNPTSRPSSKVGKSAFWRAAARANWRFGSTNLYRGKVANIPQRNLGMHPAN